MPELQGLESTEKQQSKIGGWLILVAIGLIITPVKLSIFIVRDIMPAFSNETWSVLTTPGTNAFHPLWAPLLIFELAGNVVFVVFSIIAVVFFFMKKKFVPKLVIAFLLSNLVFVASDYFAANAIPFVASQDNTESMKELARTVIACLIWVPYFLVSKRVKATFVQ